MGKEEELKVGDRVYHKEYGKGTIVEIDDSNCFFEYLVEFDNANENLHDGTWVASQRHKDKHCYWCQSKQLAELEQIVIKDIDGGERTYDLDLGRPFINWIGADGNGGIQVERISQTSEYKPAPEPDKPQEIKVKIGDKTIYSNNERKEEKENMENRVNSILEIYKQHKYDEITKEYNKKEQEITKKDSILKDVREFEKTLRKKYSNDNISLRTDYLSKETSDILAELYKEKERKELELYEYREEVKAQIKLCDTYDQVIDILVSYGIIDKKTKKIN